MNITIVYDDFHKAGVGLTYKEARAMKTIVLFFNIFYFPYSSMRFCLFLTGTGICHDHLTTALTGENFFNRRNTKCSIVWCTHVY